MSMIGSNDKLKQAAAGAGGGAGLNVEDVFSTYLYEGNDSTQTITNGIDLAGEGGMIWTKARELSRDHKIIDTARPINRTLTPNSTIAQDASSGVTSLTSTGYTLDSNAFFNTGTSYVSWTFRKAPKFFDVVTWTGDGTNSRNIPHNLGAKPGVVIVKALNNSTRNWYFCSTELQEQDQRIDVGLFLNTTAAKNGYLVMGTSTATHINTWSLDYGSTIPMSNANGTEYVAYLFAHNDGDGGFGPDGDQDIIKCGSYVGSGTSGQYIDVGFEPQWVLVKAANATSNWTLVDTMRGMSYNGSNVLSDRLIPSSSGAEGQIEGFGPTATGWYTGTRGDADSDNNGTTFIYIAIRRGPLAPPESATEVFDVYTGSDAYPTVITTGFTADSLLGALRSGNSNNFVSGSRLTGSKSLKTSSTDAQGSGLFSSATNACFMRNDGILPSHFGQSNTVYYTWKRAPGFFDVVAYRGDGTGSRVISHNLGVEPELIINKRRSGTRSWFTQAPGPLGYASLLYIDLEDAASSIGVQYGMSTASADTFTTGTSHSFVNSSGDDFITYLFSSLDGVSKVGSYTGNGTSQTIDCGFTSGARFVLIKRVNAAYGWVVFDTERGIVSGNDPFLELNTSSGENSNFDAIDPHSSGFIVTGNWEGNNYSGSEYIFYAIA